MQKIKGKLYLTGAFSLAGTSVMTGFVLSEKLPVFTITAISMGIVLVGLLPFYAVRTFFTIRGFTLRDWLMILSQALFGIFLFRIFLLFGIQYTSTAEAGILTGTSPAITAVMAYFILKERFTVFTALGISGTVFGVILLQGNSLLSAQFSGGHLLGNAFVLCAAASESTFNILSRQHMTGKRGRSSTTIHPMVQTLLVSTVAFLLSAVPALLERPFSALLLLARREWLALVWYGLVVTALAFAFFYAGAKRCDAYTIAAFSGMMPLSAMLLSLLLLHEKTTFLQWIGSTLIVLSITLIGQKTGGQHVDNRFDRNNGLSERKDGYSGIEKR